MERNKFTDEQLTKFIALGLRNGTLDEDQLYEDFDDDEIQSFKDFDKPIGDSEEPKYTKWREGLIDAGVLSKTPKVIHRPRQQE